MTKYTLFALLMVSVNSFADQAVSAPGEEYLAPHLRTTQSQKQAAVERIRDAISTGKTVSLKDNEVESPSARAINSFGEFFEKRLKASNH